MLNPEALEPRDTLLRWLVDQALPLWAETGWDDGPALFVERLDAAGRPLLDTPRRLMVQARQLFVFSLAGRRGWSPVFRDRLDAAADSFIRRFHAVDGAPGWIFSVLRSGEPADTRRDLYGHAFVLLALAHVARLTGEHRFLGLAAHTLDVLDAHMAGAAGGYVDALPPPPGGGLRQNPHMHLLEALLALHEAAPDGGYIERAGALVALMRARLMHGEVLVEHFGPDWAPRGGPDFPFEPGHHFEWAWLLTRFAALSGRPVPHEAAALWRSAVRRGMGPDGAIVDETSVKRGVLRRSTRLWPHAEAAKAACRGLGRAGDPSAAEVLAILHGRFLAPAHPGSWIDHFDEEGRAMTDFAPASSLYHIASAIDEAVNGEPGGT